MKRRWIPVLVATLLALATHPARAEAPSFVFILVDDLGYMDLGAYNPDCFHETPHIDALAASA